ncbi:hypothetical protein D9619_001589 [Psilocybe cf. subviscida]|uniref:Uncharacterized protein n=1 Tax=Psilocybe cf. subviscida TaxID=2480587 RepID=A0A8H5BFN9_9AGAR|nr:hypothetical protein D9619_001589 [Psilocybe cf. subviscida]
MVLAFRFILSPKHTKSINEHIMRPYAHWFSHQRTTDSLFRTVSFPDAIPRLGPRFHLLEEDFLKIPVPSAKAGSAQGTSYDFIVTLFFIDTSLDIFATLSHIFALLRPGGTWVNLGPLLWTGGGQASAELSLEEVLMAAKEIGFVIDKSERGPAARRTVECEYTSDKQAMMRWIYKAEYWVARKPE